MVRDTLYLWWLAVPAEPRLVGALRTDRGTRGVSLRYSSSWLRGGLALSEDLPLFDQEFLPTEPSTAAGSVDDARPDRWGERVIRFVDKPPRLSLLEYLYFAGDDRFGALGVSASETHYTPRTHGPLPQLGDTQAIYELVRKVLAGEPVAEAQRRLITPGATLGGARPKALIEQKGAAWVVKFDDGEPTDTPLVEHATMTLAARAKIRVAKTMPVPLSHGHAVAVRRFDRDKNARHHALSANVALRAAGEAMGYPELAQLLRRRGIAKDQVGLAHMHELYRRMVFNILIDNTGDHEKNHALLVTEAQEYALSPAYDVLPSRQALGYQQMRVGTQSGDSTLKNALSMCALFGLKPDEARAQNKSVAKIVATWRAH